VSSSWCCFCKLAWLNGITWHNAWLWPSQLDAADRHGAVLYAKTSMTFDVSQKFQDSLSEHHGRLLQAMQSCRSLLSLPAPVVASSGGHVRFRGTQP